MKNLFLLFIPLVIVAACSDGATEPDASGSFEADEVVVSAELGGRILSFTVQEGATLARDSVVGRIDDANVALQKEQVSASIKALSERTTDVVPQVKLLEEQLLVQQSQLNTLLREKTRTENLLKQDAATGKQLDDINAQIDLVNRQAAVTRQQINVQRSTIGSQNRGILSETAPMEKRVAQLDDQLQKANIVNPVDGAVLSKYAEEGR